MNGMPLLINEETKSGINKIGCAVLWAISWYDKGVSSVYKIRNTFFQRN